MPANDESLITKVRASDITAFEALFRAYHPVLFRQVWFRAQDPDLAEDIAQETFVRVWLNRTSLRPDSSFLSLLIRISGNLLKDHFKHEAVKFKSRDSIPPPARIDGDNPEDALQLTLLQEQIQAVANRYLPDRCRLVFVLSRIDGKSNTEIAELLRISQKTVENQLNLALKVLRKKLDPSLLKVVP